MTGSGEPLVDETTTDTHTLGPSMDTCKVTHPDRLTPLHVHLRMIPKIHISLHPSHKESEDSPLGVSSDPAKRSPLHHHHPSYLTMTMKVP